MEFSIAPGGPLHRLYLRVGLAQPPLKLLQRRIVVIVLLAWLPLTLLAGWAGPAGGVPYWQDLEMHLRFLVALPLLIAAEWFVHERLPGTVQQFLDRDLIATEDRARFDEIIASAARWRDATLAEVVLLVLVFTGGHWLWHEQFTVQAGSWFETERGFTLPGWWYAFVSLPVFRFLLFRWYYRLFIWYRFLWQVARLKLRLNALHPDRAAGLGFLGGSPQAFAPMLVAHSVLVAGMIGNRLWHEGAHLTDFKMELAGAVVLLLLMVLVPLLFFAGQLVAVQRVTSRNFGVFSSRYVESFRKRWLGGESAESLGSGDIQSLADLGGSYDRVGATQPVPFGKQTIIQLAVVIAVPLVPLALTVIPLHELVLRLVKMIL